MDLIWWIHFRSGREVKHVGTDSVFLLYGFRGGGVMTGVVQKVLELVDKKVILKAPICSTDVRIQVG